MKDRSPNPRKRQKKIMDQFSLEGKIAIVTGAGQGIGKAIALTFAEAGGDLVIVDIDRASANLTAQEILAMGRNALALVVNVCDGKQIDSMVRKTLRRFKRIDVSVHNAGGGFPTKPVLEMSEEDWDKSITLNLKSAFLCCNAVGKIMAKQKRGSIVNMSSMAGFGPYPLGANYASAKAGVKSLTENLAVELGPYNVRVNALAPGPVETPTITDYYREHPEMKEQRLKAIPLKRIASPQDIANVALFLASDASAYVSGQTILINGALATFVTPELIAELGKRFDV